MPAPQQETVMQRALRTIDRGPDDIVELLKLGRPDCIRDLARRLAEFEGVKLIGDPSLVEDAIARRIPIAEQAFRDWHSSIHQPKKGRPKNDLADNLILAAAFHKFWNGEHRGRKRAAEEAAAFLGAPATRSTVEKAEAAYRKAMAAAAHVAVSSGAATPERCRETATELILLMQSELDAIADGLRNEQAAAAASRKSARHSSFFGASAAAKIAPSQIGRRPGETETST